MKTPTVFPHRTYAHDMGSWIQDDELAKKIWARLRLDPKLKLIHWYACDLTVTSPMSITLYVYDMENSLSGGIGNKIFEAAVTDFAPNEKILLGKYVLDIYTKAAAKEFDQREMDKMNLKILKVRKELFGV